MTDNTQMILSDDLVADDLFHTIDDTPIIYANDFFRWFATWLKDKGLQFSKCGFKTGGGLGALHEIDLTTGFWKDPTYSRNKPPRWLYHIQPESGGMCAVNPNTGSLNLGAINTAQEDKAGVVFRLVPLIQQGVDDFLCEDDFEVYAFFVFHGATPKGSSSEALSFDVATGEMEFKNEALPYISAGLLGIRPRDTERQIASDGQTRTITYGEVMDALASDIKCALEGEGPVPMPVFDLSLKDEFDRLKKTISDAWAAVPVKPSVVTTEAAEDESNDEDGIVAPESLEIPENTDLLGIDPSVYRQINAALKSGKQHIMLYGPPGTGKTTLARWIATTLTGGSKKWTLITGSSDWSSQDIIGGYQPLGGGSVGFIQGVLLRNFDRPLIIDELNRCDIDKVIGPLFTVLSGQQTTLPYRLNIETPNSLQYVILPESKPSAEEHEFAPGPAWRLLATINSIDKAALYQMSYALSRRFCWVYVDVPSDTTAFIKASLRKEDPDWVVLENASCPLAEFWSKINTVRPLGPAPIIDTIKAVNAMVDGAEFFAVPTEEMKEALLDAIDMMLLPMLDGILVQDAKMLADEATELFKLNASQQDRIIARMNSVAV